MRKVNDRGVVALSEELVLVGLGGRGDGDGKSGVNGKLSEAVASGREVCPCRKLVLLESQPLTAWSTIV